jgi:hypothetical protein
MLYTAHSLKQSSSSIECIFTNLDATRNRTLKFSISVWLSVWSAYDYVDFEKQNVSSRVDWNTFMTIIYLLQTFCKTHYNREVYLDELHVNYVPFSLLHWKAIIDGKKEKRK